MLNVVTLPLHPPFAHVSSVTMKRIINFYLIREISSLFVLGIAIFTLILLMGRLIKLTDLVIARGVPLVEVFRMIAYLMPSFLVFTIPMAFLLAVLLAFGRLSSDNEITVMKSGGISLLQLMPPVIVCGIVAALITLAAGVVGIPWGNSAFKNLSFEVLKQNVSATISEKVFWDEIPGIILYTDHYDDKRQALKGVIIHDGRDPQRPLTIFAEGGTVGTAADKSSVNLVLNKGSIHASGKDNEYRLVNFGEYIMTISSPTKENIKLNQLDMSVAELNRHINDPATPQQKRLGMGAELHSRFALPFASLVFAVLAVPLGMQNRRSGKSAGFTTSIAILLAYYLLLSLMRTLAERGILPPMLALWLPNLIFLSLGLFFLRMASMEKAIPIPTVATVLRIFRKAS